MQSGHGQAFLQTTSYVHRGLVSVALLYFNYRLEVVNANYAVGSRAPLCWDLKKNFAITCPTDLMVDWVPGFEPQINMITGVTYAIRMSLNVTSKTFLDLEARSLLPVGTNASTHEQMCFKNQTEVCTSPNDPLQCCYIHINLHFCLNKPGIFCGPWVRNDNLLSSHTHEQSHYAGFNGKACFDFHLTPFWEGRYTIIGHVKLGAMHFAIGTTFNARYSADVCPSPFVPSTNGCERCGVGTQPLSSGIPRGAKQLTDEEAVARHSNPYCVHCPPGQFSADGIFCVTCPYGSYTNASKQPECIPCPIGMAQDEANSTVCKECPPGKFASNFASSACTDCSIGRYTSHYRQSDCAQCGPRKDTMQMLQTIDSSPQWFALSGSTTASDCRCAFGYRLNGNTCVPCVQKGIKCLGEPRIEAGFYADTTFSIFYCQPANRCKGGVAGQTCEVGRTGIACSECKPGMAPAESGKCADCQGPDLFPLCMFIVGLVLMLLGIYYIFDTVNVGGVQHSKLLIAITLGELIAFAQLLGIVHKSFYIQFPEPLCTFLDAISFFVFEVEILRLGCVVYIPPVKLFLLKAATIFGSSLSLLIIHFFFVMIRHDGKFKSRQPSLFATIGTLFNVFYLSVTSTVVAPLQCRSNPNGKWTMHEYRGVVCWESKDHATMIIAGMLALLFPLGYLSTCIKLAFQYPEKVRRLKTAYLYKYSFLFARVKPDAYWYGVVIMCRNMFFAVVPIIPVGSAVALLVLQMSIVSLLMITIQFRPWRVNLGNKFDIAANFIVNLFLTVASSYATDSEANKNLIVHIILIGVAGIVTAFTVGICYGSIKSLLWRSKRYKFFLCHHKASSGAYTRMLKMYLVEQASCKSGNNIFIDADDLSNLDALFDLVGSDVETLLIVASALVFTRPWCVGEITTAWSKNVNLRSIQLPDFGGLDTAQIDNFDFHAEGMHILSRSYISAENVRNALHFCKNMPMITVPPEVNDSVTRSLAAKLMARDRDGPIASRTSTSDLRTFEKDTLPPVILCDSSYTEASSAALVLAKMLVADSLQVILDYESGTVVDTTIILFCTRCLENPHLPGLLLEVARHEPKVLPVMIEEGFRPPSPQVLRELCVRSPVKDREALPGLLAALIEIIFRQIAVEFPVSMASEAMLRTISSSIARRLQSSGRISEKDLIPSTRSLTLQNQTLTLKSVGSESSAATRGSSPYIWQVNQYGSSRPGSLNAFTTEDLQAELERRGVASTMVSYSNVFPMQITSSKEFLAEMPTLTENGDDAIEWHGERRLAL